MVLNVLKFDFIERVDITTVKDRKADVSSASSDLVLSTRLIKPNFHVTLSQRRSITVTLGTRILVIYHLIPRVKSLDE